MSAWVERMGPMYHEGAYFDDAVTVSFFNPLDTWYKSYFNSTKFLENQNLVLKVLILFI